MTYLNWFNKSSYVSPIYEINCIRSCTTRTERWPRLASRGTAHTPPPYSTTSYAALSSLLDSDTHMLRSSTLFVFDHRYEAQTSCTSCIPAAYSC